MKDKIRIVCIGSGWVVTNRHVPALTKSGRFNIVAIAGQKKEKLKPIAQKYHIPGMYTGDATKNPQWLDGCDAVMIGVDPLNHYKLAKFCLEHDKHVLMEKPFTMSIKDSKELVELAKKKKRVLCIVQNFQFADSAKQLDADIEAGKLGKITGIHAAQLGNDRRRLPTWYEKLPWGLYFDESPHLLYLLQKYGHGVQLQSSVKVSSTRGLNTPALVNAIFKTSAGFPASLSLNFEAPLSEWFIWIYGENGTGLLDIFRDIYIFLPNDNGHKASDILRTSQKAIVGHVLGTARSGFKEVAKNHIYGNDKVVTTFADAIEHSKKPTGISADEALRINELQFEIIDQAIIH